MPLFAYLPLTLGEKRICRIRIFLLEKVTQSKVQNIPNSGLSNSSNSIFCTISEVSLPMQHFYIVREKWHGRNRYRLMEKLQWRLKIFNARSKIRKFARPLLLKYLLRRFRKSKAAKMFLLSYLKFDSYLFFIGAIAVPTHCLNAHSRICKIYHSHLSTVSSASVSPPYLTIVHFVFILSLYQNKRQRVVEHLEDCLSFPSSVEVPRHVPYS